MTSTRMSCSARFICARLGDTQNAQSGQMLQLAITEYEKLAQLKPNDIETHLLLGQLYSFNHDSAKADGQFQAARKIDRQLRRGRPEHGPPV